MVSEVNVVQNPWSSEIDTVTYDFLRDYIHTTSGIALDDNKHYLLEARLMPVVRANHLGTLKDLCALLRGTVASPLKQQVVEAMTTHETYFFRDPAQYDALKTSVLPLITERRQISRSLTFWSAASSSGQEAYSLAMMLLEMGLGNWSIRILGTDLSSRILERARTGRYQQLEVNRGLPVTYLVKYFARMGLEWQLKDEVRRMVEFRAIDLRDDLSSMGPFDVIFCRNVLIYFDLESRKKILRQIRSTLHGGGYLLLGSGETILNLDTSFKMRTFGKTLLYEAP